MSEFKCTPTHCIHCGSTLTKEEAKKYETDIEGDSFLLPEGFCADCAPEYDHKFIAEAVIMTTKTDGAGRIFWNNGDECQYTGKSEMLHGAMFYEAKIIETGKIFVTSINPETKKGFWQK
jgi:hypothetical protein